MRQVRLKTNEHVESSDMALSAFLSMFYSLEAIDRTNPQKALFTFKRDDQIDKYIEAYWRGEARVSPQAYFQALKLLKSRLYEK